MKEQEGNNRDNFENLWQAAMEGQSVDPPKQVWVELDRALANAELITAKKQIGLYKWSAAAAVIIGLSLSVIALTNQFTIDLGEDPGELVIQQRVDQSSPENISGNFQGYGILDDNTFWGSSSASGNYEASSGNSPANRSPLIALNEGMSGDIDNENVLDRTSVNLFSKSYNPGFRSSKPGSAQNNKVNRLPDYNYITRPLPVKRDTRNSKNDKFWAGFDLSSGYFNPNYSQSSTNEVAATLVQKNNSDGRRSSVPELSESMRGGASYSVGMNLGMQLKEKWTLESGVQYSLLGARTLTNLILESETYNRAVALSSEVSGLQTVSEVIDDALTEISVDDIDLNNTFQFISLPVQAGYIILDSKFNVKINGGIAANLYLGNRLRGSSGSASFEIDPGETSPYRELTFSGVAGLELGYRILERVNLTFEPNYQQSFQSLTKSTSNFATNPNGVGVQAGLKYSF